MSRIKLFGLIARASFQLIHRNAVAGGAIVGARLGVSKHLEENAKVFDFVLDRTDLDQLHAVLEKSRDLYQLIGDCGDEYRR